MRLEWAWDKLDPFERQVAELLVQGKSNAAVCAEVFLSRARVQDCIKRILIKTGADSTRAAIALLVEERENLSLLRVLEQATDGVVVVQDRVVKFVNRALLEMNGYELEEIVGMSFIELVAPRSRGAVLRQHELRLKGEPFRTLYAIGIACKGGQEKDVVVANAGQIRFKGGHAIMVALAPHEEEGRRG